MIVEIDVSRRVIKMDRGEDDVGDGDIWLCYDGENRTRSAILVMLCLVVYNNSWRLGRWYWRHLRMYEWVVVIAGPEASRRA